MQFKTSLLALAESIEGSKVKAVLSYRTWTSPLIDKNSPFSKIDIEIPTALNVRERELLLLEVVYDVKIGIVEVLNSQVIARKALTKIAPVKPRGDMTYLEFSQVAIYDPSTPTWKIPPKKKRTEKRTDESSDLSSSITGEPPIQQAVQSEEKK